MRILIFGDSTAQGYYGLETGGWANLLYLDILKSKLRRTDYITELFNVSVSGDTTRRITQRLQVETEARKWGAEKVLLVFAVGVNDTLTADGVPYSSIDRYARDVSELYDVASQLSNQIIFVGLESVHEPESAPWLFNSGSQDLVWTNERIRLFDQSLKKFTLAKDATYIPIFEEFRKRQQQGVSVHAEGLHPNTVGHRLIYQRVKPVLDEMITRS